MLEAKISVSAAQIYVRMSAMDTVILVMKVSIILLTVVHKQPLIQASVRVITMAAITARIHQMEMLPVPSDIVL